MSPYRLTLALLAAAGLATAIPNANTKPSSTTKSLATPTPTYYSDPQIARFENDPNLGNPIVAAQPVNIYDDIFYNGFTGVVDSDQTGVGILPQSPSNSISYGPLLVGTIDQGPAAMTTVYQDTTVDFFDLTSLYYGCEDNTQVDPATVLTSCSITATCISPKGQQVAQQNFNFVANGALSQQMIGIF